MYKLVWTPSFTRAARQFVKHHPELKASLARVLRDIEKDPAQPRLRLHTLHGRLKGMYAVRITHRYRMTLMVNVNSKEIVLLDIGSHDEVYG